MTGLLDVMRRTVAGGGKLLVPYVMAGIPDHASFPAVASRLAALGDALEVGIPYSDPLMDGPVIAAAAERAIRDGTGPGRAFDLSGAIDAPGPRVAMTYYNPVHRIGEEAFCDRAVEAGFAGLIVPDLPLEASDGLRRACAERDLAWIPLVAPTSTPARVEAIAGTATGFVYAVSTLGVTGVRRALAESAATVVAACRAATDRPVLVGIGVSDADQARVACGYADGVVMGSAVVRRILDEGVDAAVALLRTVRRALSPA